MNTSRTALESLRSGLASNSNSKWERKWREMVNHRNRSQIARRAVKNILESRVAVEGNKDAFHVIFTAQKNVTDKESKIRKIKIHLHNVAIRQREIILELDELEEDEASMGDSLTHPGEIIEDMFSTVSSLKTNEDFGYKRDNDWNVEAILDHATQYSENCAQNISHIAKNCLRIMKRRAALLNVLLELDNSMRSMMENLGVDRIKGSPFLDNYLMLLKKKRNWFPLASLLSSANAHGRRTVKSNKSSLSNNVPTQRTLHPKDALASTPKKMLHQKDAIPLTPKKSRASYDRVYRDISSNKISGKVGSRAPLGTNRSSLWNPASDVSTAQESGRTVPDRRVHQVAMVMKDARDTKKNSHTGVDGGTIRRIEDKTLLPDSTTPWQQSRTANERKPSKVTVLKVNLPLSPYKPSATFEEDHTLHTGFSSTSTLDSQKYYSRPMGFQNPQEGMDVADTELCRERSLDSFTESSANRDDLSYYSQRYNSVTAVPNVPTPCLHDNSHVDTFPPPVRDSRLNTLSYHHGSGFYTMDQPGHLRNNSRDALIGHHNTMKEPTNTRNECRSELRNAVPLVSQSPMMVDQRPQRMHEKLSPMFLPTTYGDAEISYTPWKNAQLPDSGMRMSSVSKGAPHYCTTSPFIGSVAGKANLMSFSSLKLPHILPATSETVPLKPSSVNPTPYHKYVDQAAEDTRYTSRRGCSLFPSTSKTKNTSANNTQTTSPGLLSLLFSKNTNQGSTGRASRFYCAS